MSRARQQTVEFFERKLVQAQRRLELFDPEPRPQPASTILTADNAPVVRRLACARYSACLDLAYSARWDGFGCGSCPAFLAQTKEQYLADVEGIADLVAAITRGERHQQGGASWLTEQR